MAKREMNRRQEDWGNREELSRMEESRSLDTKEAEKRPVFNMYYQDPMHFDKSEIPEGYEYYWVRDSWFDQPDIGSQVDAKRKGWTPVPASRHPDRVFTDFFGRLTHTDDFIRYKGATLCERPIYLCEQERAAYDKLNYEKIVSMPGTENFLGEPSIPGMDRGHTAIGRSRTT